MSITDTHILSKFIIILYTRQYKTQYLLNIRAKFKMLAFYIATLIYQFQTTKRLKKYKLFQFSLIINDFYSYRVMYMCF